MAGGSFLKETNIKDYLQRTASVFQRFTARLVYVPVGDGQCPSLRSVNSGMKGQTAVTWRSGMSLRKYSTAQTHTDCYISQFDTVYSGTVLVKRRKWRQQVTQQRR